MNKLILSCDESRELDRQAIEVLGIPSIVLMENAGRGIAEFLLSLKISGTIVICCGKGNNAGDGFVIARHLDNNGISVHVLLCSLPSELSKDAKINYNILTKSAITITHINEGNIFMIQKIFSSATWIVDALLGTGLKGEVREPYKTIIQVINHSSAKVISVDIPSGLDGNIGKPLSISVQADYTITFVSLKRGFINPESKKFTGEVSVINIGISRILLGN